VKLIFDNVTVEDAKELLSCVDINVEHLKFTEETASSASANTHIAQALREIAAEIDGVADAWQTMDLKGAATRARDWARQLRNV